jgi:hypothetical protein
LNRHVNQSTIGHTLLANIPGWKEVRNMAPHLRRFDASEVAKERLKIIKFYTSHGEVSTKEAFGIGRKTICVWKKRLKDKGPGGLVPFKTIPVRKRTISIDPGTYEFIAKLRQIYYRLGKMKIKPLLDEYCLKENLPTCSVAKIGRIIKRNSLFYQKAGRFYHDVNYTHKKKFIKRERVK